LTIKYITKKINLYIMNETVKIIIFIIVASTLFPLVGFYLDFRYKKKLFGKDKKK
jgi:hypothetical protein